MTIAILGATGHVAKNLIYYFLAEKTQSIIYLYARNTEKIKDFLTLYCEQTQKQHEINVKTFDEFTEYSYDVLVNCVGISNTKMQQNVDFEIFTVTEKYDTLCSDYLVTHQKTRYINFSSGAVYGTEFSQPVDQKTKTEIAVNNIQKSDYYRLAKLYSEAKHRALCDYFIVDIRIFSFFSRFIDLESSFLITEMINCVRQKKPFITNENNIIRDYTHPYDLFRLVLEIIYKKEFVNTSIDLYSAKPTSKFELIEFFQQNYRMEVELTTNPQVSATGLKNVYCSQNKSEDFLWTPQYESIEGIEREMKKQFSTGIND